MAVDLRRVRALADTARQRMGEGVATKRTVDRSWYRIENAAGEDGRSSADIYLYDMIGEWGHSAQDFISELNAVNAEVINLYVNCEGGEVFDGLAIYEALRRHSAEVISVVDGIAASMASVVVQASDKIMMAKRGRMMIHDAHGFAIGNARDMREMADLLDALSDTIADIYADRAGGTRASWRKAMSAAQGGPDGTWYDAKSAVDAGLADGVMESGEKPGNTAPKIIRHVQPEAQGVEISGYWDRADLLGAIREFEDPTEPVAAPDPQDLLSAFTF